MNKFTLFFVILFLSNSAFAQLGKEFWFVAPEVTSGHRDKPLVFRITTSDKAADVTISMPANPGFSPVSFSIPPHTQKTYEVDKNVVENRPSNKVLNKGIFIKSNNDITAYYEVIGEGLNPDKFTLKGRNALGTEFYIPSQNIYVNQHNLTPIADEKADIVATEDNTEITVIPTVNIVGHAANVPFTIVLNRGQTFSLEYTDISKYASLAGTYIKSDKPVAVTISDDSIDDIEEQPGPYDLIGDQLIPTSVIGTEYIAVKTSTDSRTINKVFILAIEDDTYVWLNNDKTLIKHLNKGDVVNFDITDNAIYIKSNKPVYAYQLASFWNRKGNELGSAILPSITCTGSQWVSFTRTFTDKFNIQLLTKGKNRNAFILRDQNGNVLNDLDNAKWKLVPGTGGGNPDERWYSLSMPLNITTGAPHMIENTKGLFHMSILDEHIGSVSYGYFSSYGTLTVNGLTEECVGNTVVLTTEEPMKSYEWFSSNSGTTPLSTEPSLSVTESGKYWVKAEVNFGGCVAIDTIDVNFFLPDVDLGPDTASCVGETISLENKFKDQGEYLWNDNSTENSLDVPITPALSKEIWLEITDIRGCTNRDTVVVSSFPEPALDLTHVPSDVCIGDTIFNKTECSRYQWSINGTENPADTLNYIVAKQSGTYALTGWNENECSVTESISITAHQLPSVNLSDVIECPDENETFTGPSGMTSYLWMNNTTSRAITISSPDTVWLEVTDNYGCVNRDTALYQWYAKPMFKEVRDTSVCINSDITLTVDAGLNNYQWLYKTSNNTTDLNNSSSSYLISNADPDLHEGDYIVFAKDNNGCDLSDTLTLDVMTVPDLSLGGNRDICEGDTIQIESNPGYVKYNWSKDNVPGFSDKPYILVAEGGTYHLDAEMANGCTNNDEIEVQMLGKPTVKLSDDFKVCPGSSFDLTIKSFSSPNTGGIKSRIWNTGEETASITKQDTGTYSILVFDNAGCFDYDSIKVGWHTLPQWRLDKDTAICDNTSLTLQSPLDVPSEANGYQWSKTEETGNVNGPANTDWEINTDGTYILTINDLNDCVTDDTINVTLKVSPVLDLGPDREMCYGDTIKSVTEDIFAKYVWNNDTLLNEPALQATNSGDIKLKVWNDVGCNDSDVVNITVNPLPVIGFADMEACAGTDTVISAPEGMETYLWSTGDTTKDISILEGIYSLTVTDTKGCSNNDTLTFTWHPVPDVNLGNDTSICQVDNIVLDAGNGYTSYLWHNGATSQTITANFADTVNLVKVKNQYQCYGFDTKMVRMLPPPEFSLNGDTAICSPDTLLLDAGDGFVIINWFDGTHDQYNVISETGDYWVNVFDGCSWMYDTASVIVNPSPVVSVIDTTVFSQIVIYPDGGTEPYMYALNNESFQDKNVFSNLENGTYYVYVKDANSCMTQDTVQLSGNGEIEVPNFFTPNGDGINDRWEIAGIEKYPESNIKIYNRYGKQLYEYRGEDQGWNGEYLGRPVHSDDYWYVIHLIPTDKIIKGHVTVKR